MPEPERSTERKENQMLKFSLLSLAALLALVVAAPALAQEDFPLKPPVAGQFPLKVQIVSDEPLASLCIDRVDVDPPLELFCLQDPPFAAGSTIDLLFLIPITPGDDAEIRARVMDMTGNASGYSPNAAIADFTAPAAPVLIATP